MNTPKYSPCYTHTHTHIRTHTHTHTHLLAPVISLTFRSGLIPQLGVQ